MIRSLKKLSLLALFSCFVSTANAGVLIEPYLGYQFGQWKQGTGKADFSGAAFGARLGYKHFLGIMFGVDYETGKFADKATNSSDMTPSQIGAFVGYEFPILLRVYGTYNFSDQMKFEGQGNTATMKGDSGIKLGVGFTALPLLSINLEYQASSYPKSSSSTVTNELTTKTYGLYVSIPLDI